MRKFQIIVLEDNPGDLYLIRASIQEAGLDCEIKSFTDGAAAIEYVDQATSPVPDLVIMDWNLPGVEGSSVLSGVRANARCAHVPIFVFTASQSPRDIAQVKMLGGDRYVIKPADLEEFQKFGQQIKEWFEEQHR